VANSQAGQVQYNFAQVNPAEFHSFWDLLNPKWKNKMASLDPTTFGMGAALQLFYCHPELGSGFLGRLYGEMQFTVSRDARLIPMRQKCLSTGFLRAKDKSPYRKLGRPDAHNSRRVDIANDDVDPYNRLEEGKNISIWRNPSIRIYADLQSCKRSTAPEVN